VGIGRLKRLIKNNKFTLPTKSKELITGYAEILDPLFTLKEQLVKDKNGFTSREDLFKLYQEICKKEGRIPTEYRIFLNNFRTAFKNLEEKRESTGERKWGFLGITIPMNIRKDWGI